MGLFSNVLLLPLAPVRGVLWVAQVLADVASKELNDPQTLRARLREAEDAHRRGEISAEDLDRIEDAVFSQLVALQQRGGVS
ncbi:MAG TPA: gas vesicle protein GvpG [Actinomycetota bacterium]|nr:gas vesicle protein GvpG [Actinomycetota bacterium]